MLALPTGHLGQPAGELEVAAQSLQSHPVLRASRLCLGSPGLGPVARPRYRHRPTRLTNDRADRALERAGGQRVLAAVHPGPGERAQRPQRPRAVVVASTARRHGASRTGGRGERGAGVPLVHGPAAAAKTALDRLDRVRGTEQPAQVGGDIGRPVAPASAVSSSAGLVTPVSTSRLSQPTLAAPSMSVSSRSPTTSGRSARGALDGLPVQRRSRLAGHLGLHAGRRGDRLDERAVAGRGAAGRRAR